MQFSHNDFHIDLLLHHLCATMSVPRITGRSRAGIDGPLQLLLELRLLRVFRELRDPNTKRMLIELTEQIVRRQASRQGGRANPGSASKRACAWSRCICPIDGW
jgi:hypothetical protein